MANVNFRLRKNGLDKNKQPKTEPVAIQVYYYHEGVEVEMSTGLKVLPHQFVGSRVSGHPQAKGYNKSLSQLEAALYDVHVTHRNKSKVEHENIVRELIKGEAPTPQKKTILEVVAQWIALSENDWKTLQKYKALQKRLTEFSSNYDFDLQTLDFNFLDAFKTFLYGQPNPYFTKYHLEHDRAGGFYLVCPNRDGVNYAGLSIGLLDEIVFKYITNLKVFCAWAVERGFEVNHAYKKWKTIKREYPPISLTEDELTRLENYDFKQRHLDIARDYLSLECRTGQRISDLRRFSKPDLHDNTWHFTQKKGNRQKAKHIQLPLVGYCSNALVILEKYNYVLPKISEQKLNENIKTVCKLVGIDSLMYIERYAGNKKIRIPGPKNEFISTHTGKKTFVTLLAAQGIPVKVISDFTGTSIKTIERHYLGTTDLVKAKEWLTKGSQDKSIMKIA